MSALLLDLRDVAQAREWVQRLHPALASDIAKERQAALWIVFEQRDFQTSALVGPPRANGIALAAVAKQWNDLAQRQVVLRRLGHLAKLTCACGSLLVMESWLHPPLAGEAVVCVLEHVGLSTPEVFAAVISTRNGQRELQDFVSVPLEQVFPINGTPMRTLLPDQAAWVQETLPLSVVDFRLRASRFLLSEAAAVPDPWRRA